MKLIPDATERAQLTEQLTRLLRAGLSRQTGITKQDVVLYTCFSNCMMVMHTHDFHCPEEMKSMLENIKELLPHVQNVKCTEAERILDITIAHLEEAITDATFEHRR